MKPRPSTQALLGLQLALSLAVLAFVPNHWAKLLALLLCWALGFGAITRAELFMYLSVSAAFSLMDIMAVRQGVFKFSSPDLLGLPVWEFFMWGFYVLHAVRMLDGPIPRSSLRVAVVLGGLFAVPFVTLTDPWMLLAASGAMLGLALAFFREPRDWIYVGYMIALGAGVEYTGVWSGHWSYPGNPLGGVPLWFVTMWGGVGLFVRRLVVPLVYRHTASSMRVGT